MRVIKLDENGTIDRRKDQFVELYNNQTNEDIQKSEIEQHHINKDRSQNPSNFSNMLEIYSSDPIQRRAAHKYIHAKNLVDNYSPQDVYILQADGSKIPVTTKLLDYYASILPYDITSVDKTDEEQD